MTDKQPRWLEYVPLDDLVPDPRNPKDHTIEDLRASLGRFGYTEPISVDERTGMISSGHGRREMLLADRDEGVAAAEGIVVDGQGRWTVPVVRGWHSENDDEALAYLIAANQLTTKGGWNDADLAAALERMTETPLKLDGIGFNQDELDRLLVNVRGHERHLGGGDPDELPPAPAQVVSRLGDVWLLGPHRVLCGDSRVDGIETVLDGERAVAVWTDPPYGVEYVGKTGDALTIENDDAAGLPSLLADVFERITPAVIEGAAVYVAAPPGRLHLDFFQAFVGAGWRYHETLIWVKDRFVLGHSDYHFQHEPIMYGYTPGGGRRGRGAVGWYGNDAQSSLLEFARPAASEEHPTMKPVALVGHCIANSAPLDGLVLDPFGGSGSTLIAAHDTGRRAALVELSPAYVDVICARWQRLTGEKPVLAATGEPHDFL